MQKYNINSILIIIGFATLLIGFFMDQEQSLDVQLHDTYIVLSKSQALRVLGILTILNGLVYALFSKLNFRFNIRFKYFGIILFFISLAIVLSVILFSGQTLKQGSGSLISLHNNGLSVLMLVAGFSTLIISLFMPLFIWLNFAVRNFIKH